MLQIRHYPLLSVTQVDGTDAAWDRLQLYLSPVSPTAHQPMSPALLLEMLPVAHKYDFQTAFEDCMAAVGRLSPTYTVYCEPGYISHQADVLKFIELGETLQVCCIFYSDLTFQLCCHF